MQITDVKLDNDGIARIESADALPAATEIAGEVGSEGLPFYFEVAIRVSFSVRVGFVTIRHSHYFRLAVPFGDDDSDRGVQHRATQQLAPMLRSLADQIEESLAESTPVPETGVEGLGRSSDAGQIE